MIDYRGAMTCGSSSQFSGMDCTFGRSIALEHRVELIMLYGECGRNAEATARKFNTIHAGGNTIPGRYVRWLVEKFKKTGIVVDLKKTGRPATASNDITALSVIKETEANPGSSLIRIAQTCGTSRSSVQRILKREKFKRYVEQQMHELRTGDTDKRFEFCSFFLNKIDISSVIFTDEAMFSLHGRVSKVYTWARSNPRRYTALRSQQNPKLMVWVGIIGNQIVGPHFFSGHVTGKCFLISVNLYLQFSQFLHEPTPSRSNPTFRVTRTLEYALVAARRCTTSFCFERAQIFA